MERDMGTWVKVLQLFRGKYQLRPPVPPTEPTVIATSSDGGTGPADVRQLINDQRAVFRLKLLNHSVELATWAQGWARHMDLYNQMSHSPSIGEALLMTGYQWWTYGENVAGPWSDGSPTKPSEAVDMWMRSPMHRKNILSLDFADVGVGFSGGYWCATFGRRR